MLSDYSGEAFGTLSKEELVRRLLAHQRVVERIMQEHTILPVKFGTLLNNSQEVNALLSQGHSEFLDALAAIQDKVEIEVAATWDTSRVLQEISKEEDVVRAREAIIHKGQPTTEGRVQLGQLVKASMDGRRNSYRKRMIDFLKPTAIDTQPNNLVSDEMVMNVAFLVNRARQEEFDEHINQLDDLFQNEITFRVIGPLPPYSFSTVEITPLTPEQVEEAQDILHLRDVISEAEVRKAYRRLAAEEQRNLKTGDKLAKDRFARLKQASELLLRYCRARSEPQRDKRALTSPDDHPFVITIKRLRPDEVEPTRFSGPVRVEGD